MTTDSPAAAAAAFPVGTKVVVLTPPPARRGYVIGHNRVGSPEVCAAAPDPDGPDGPTVVTEHPNNLAVVTHGAPGACGPPVTATPEEAKRMLDEAARYYLGISGAVFRDRWATGYYDRHPEERDAPGVQNVRALLVFERDSFLEEGPAHRAQRRQQEREADREAARRFLADRGLAERAAARYLEALRNLARACAFPEYHLEGGALRDAQGAEEWVRDLLDGLVRPPGARETTPSGLDSPTAATKEPCPPPNSTR